MSRATLQDHSFLGHQGVYTTIMRQAPQEGPGVDGGRRPSRLLQMRDDYQRRLMKEKEERMVSMYETQQKKNLERAERLTKAPPAHDDYPNSRLRQPGYMQQQQAGSPGQASSNNPSVRDFFRERREIESTGGYVPPINQHFNDSRTMTGSGRAHQKNSAGVDRANPLAPLQHTRQGGISSAPTQNSAKNKPQLVKQNASSPDLDVNGRLKVNQRVPQRRGSQPARDKPAAGRAAPKSEKLSDFQKWQMEQNKAREERLKKLNMRAPPSERESRGWGGGYEYEEEAGDDDQEDDDDGGRFVDVDQGQEEEIRRREQEILQRIAQQQEELDRLRREREEEEELERQQAEELRRQQVADRERRQRQQQEEARRRRQEVAQARREEEEQQRAARARQERQRFEAHLDLHGDESSPTGYASQPSSYRERYSQPSSYRENPFQSGSHRDNFSQPDSSRYRLESDASVHQPTSKFTPKPPSEGNPRKASQTRFQQQQQQQQRQRQQQRPVQKRGALPAEEHNEVPVPGPGVDFYAQAVDEEQGVKVRLVACKHCQRKFADDRIRKHQDACKNAQKKREAFDPTQMRTDGTDMAKYIRQGAHMKEHKTKKKADWRQQHQEFITNIRYAKQVQQLEQKGVAAKDLPAPPPSKADPDLVPCPHCGRTFNEQSAERHIPRCRELKTRPVANNRSRR